MQKTCFKCGETLDIEEFYRHPMMADGRLGKCKSCARRDVAANRGSKASKYLAHDRHRYYRDGAEHRGSSNWAKKNPDKARAASKEYAKRNREKKKASDAVNNAVRDRRITRQPCSICGSTYRVHGHHHDYDRPLYVIWLCPRHHARAHFLLREVERNEEDRTP